MTTPIYDFVKEYAEKNGARLHMPGHKGRGALGVEAFDITEISGADVLYSADGIIAESEDFASRLFGTHHSFYSTQGSTLAIFAMLRLATRDAEKPLVLAARNVHASFVRAAALLDLEVEFLYPSSACHLCACSISTADVESALLESEKKFSAVYITSPDYLGNVADVKGIADVCKKHGTPLLVDNAHGAYLRFLSEDMHPITLGAAMCADSAHKTLPVLTGGAYLHVSKDYPEYADGAREALSLFASTSPSYLTLVSLDLCNKRLSEDYPSALSGLLAKVSDVKTSLSSLGFAVECGEPLKIVINAAKCGFEGAELSEILRKNGIEAEFADREYLVLMPTPENSDADFEKLVSALREVKIGKATETKSSPRITRHERAVSIRRAVFAPSETLSVHDAVGRVCASPTVACPPAVPIVVSGEKITEEDVFVFECYGIEKISVLK
jgi:arginine/lysine/ornithine decarboxylase